MYYDVIIIGSGPGGYVAAIRAAQLKMKVAVVENSELGGICLNWGCIPTKALLKSAQVYKYVQHAAEYGINIEGIVMPDFEAIVKRSRTVAETMSKGIQFLLKKNQITVINGFGSVVKDKKVAVAQPDGSTEIYEAGNIIVATGSHSRSLPHIPQDGKTVIGYREALSLPKLPTSMVVMGSGAIGSEFAYFYASMGTKVTLVECLLNIAPTEDEEISKLLDRSFRKMGIKIMTSASVESVLKREQDCVVMVRDIKGNCTEIVCETLLSAVGISANLENMGLEEYGIIIEKNKIVVNEFYATNCADIYAIGDIVHGPALAHVASHEAIVCVEHIAGLNPHLLDYGNIPGCIYTTPEIASVGLSEKECIERGLEIRVGKCPFTASGKATASGNREGLVKVIFEKNSDAWLGCHLFGDNVTEMIAGVVIARNKKCTGRDILSSVYPHPTLSETIMEAVAAAYGKAIHL